MNTSDKRDLECLLEKKRHNMLANAYQLIDIIAVHVLPKELGKKKYQRLLSEGYTLEEMIYELEDRSLVKPLSSYLNEANAIIAVSKVSRLATLMNR